MSELLTASEVADILRVDQTTVRRWVKQGTLEAVVLPSRSVRQSIRIKRETLNKVLGELDNQNGEGHSEDLTGNQENDAHYNTRDS
jgi:excisionase family DNA binding protein